MNALCTVVIMVIMVTVMCTEWFVPVMAMQSSCKCTPKVGIIDEGVVGALIIDVEHGVVSTTHLTIPVGDVKPDCVLSLCS